MSPSRRYRLEDLATPTDCPERASRARNYMPLRRDRLTCRPVQDKATAPVEQKGSKARLPALILEMASPMAARAMVEATVRVRLLPADSDQSRWFTRGRKSRRPIRARRRLQWRSRTNLIRFIPRKREI